MMNRLDLQESQSRPVANPEGWVGHWVVVELITGATLRGELAGLYSPGISLFCATLGTVFFPWPAVVRIRPDIDGETQAER